MLSETLQALGWHVQALPLCHLEALVAGAVLNRPALVAASHLKLAKLAEALSLRSLADKAQQQAGEHWRACAHDVNSFRLGQSHALSFALLPCLTK